jgi:hypothetical protein
VGSLTDYPLLLFVSSFVALWASTRIGASSHGSKWLLDKEARQDLGVIQAATLSLLGLIIGFSFSMTTGRYDQRKNYEAAEANAIGTEYVRADLLPAPEAMQVRALLVHYLDQRVLFYSTRDEKLARQANVRTSQLQSELWGAILPAAAARPTPLAAVAVTGMNDVLNSQAYAQASWWNRIPTAAWILMITVALIGTFLVGLGMHDVQVRGRLVFVLPGVLSITFFLIADIDSPRHGVIHVRPQNLDSLVAALRTH